MCYNVGMNISVGIVLFIVGTVGAFVVAAAAIAYLRTLSVYMGLKRLYRASFNVGMVAIAVLTSALIAQMLMEKNVPDMINTVASATTGVVTTDDGQIDEPQVEIKDDVASVEVDRTANAAAQGAADAGSKDESGSASASEPVAQPKNKLVPSFSVWTNVYKGHEYAYVEVENSVPYVYKPNAQGSFWYDLNNISAGRESGNIVIMANAGVFNMDTLQPVGTTIQNGKVVSDGEATKSKQTLVIDAEGNVGYIKSGAVSTSSSYVDVLTGKTVSGKKIVSAVTAFVPVVLNGKKATAYEKQFSNYRARSIFCVRGKGSYTLITNTGEGESGGWNFDDMATVSLRRGCQFAFNLDGGGSTSLAWRTSIHSGFSVYAATERYVPTFIVFTVDNLAPSGK